MDSDDGLEFHADSHGCVESMKTVKYRYGGRSLESLQVRALQPRATQGPEGRWQSIRVLERGLNNVSRNMGD